MLSASVVCLAKGDAWHAASDQAYWEMLDILSVSSSWVSGVHTGIDGSEAAEEG